MSTFVSPPHGDVVRSAPHDQKASTELSAATAAQDEPRVSASLSTADARVSAQAKAETDTTLAQVDDVFFSYG